MTTFSIADLVIPFAYLFIGAYCAGFWQGCHWKPMGTRRLWRFFLDVTLWPLWVRSVD